MQEIRAGESYLDALDGEGARAGRRSRALMASAALMTLNGSLIMDVPPLSRADAVPAGSPDAIKPDPIATSPKRKIAGPKNKTPRPKTPKGEPTGPKPEAPGPTGEATNRALTAPLPTDFNLLQYREVDQLFEQAKQTNQTGEFWSRFKDLSDDRRGSFGERNGLIPIKESSKGVQQVRMRSPNIAINNLSDTELDLQFEKAKRTNQTGEFWNRFKDLSDNRRRSFGERNGLIPIEGPRRGLAQRKVYFDRGNGGTEQQNGPQIQREGTGQPIAGAAGYRSEIQTVGSATGGNGYVPRFGVDTAVQALPLRVVLGADRATFGSASDNKAPALAPSTLLANNRTVISSAKDDVQTPSTQIPNRQVPNDLTQSERTSSGSITAGNTPASKPSTKIPSTLISNNRTNTGSITPAPTPAQVAPTPVASTPTPDQVAPTPTPTPPVASTPAQVAPTQVAPTPAPAASTPTPAQVAPTQLAPTPAPAASTPTPTQVAPTPTPAPAPAPAPSIASPVAKAEVAVATEKAAPKPPVVETVAQEKPASTRASESKASSTPTAKPETQIVGAATCSDEGDGNAWGVNLATNGGCWIEGSSAAERLETCRKLDNGRLLCPDGSEIDDPSSPAAPEPAATQSTPKTSEATNSSTCVDEGSDHRLNWGVNPETNAGCWVSGSATMSDCVADGQDFFDCPDGKRYNQSGVLI